MAIDMFISHLYRERSEVPNQFGIICCPGCELSWTQQFIPEYCPRCNAKVTDNPTPSFKNIYQYLKKVGGPFSQCLYCKRDIYGEPERWRNNSCPYCGGDLKLIQKATRSFRRKFMNSGNSTPRK